MGTPLGSGTCIAVGMHQYRLWGGGQSHPVSCTPWGPILVLPAKPRICTKFCFQGWLIVKKAASSATEWTVAVKAPEAAQVVRRLV